MDTDPGERIRVEWRQQLVDEARTWLWTPYQHRGRVKGVGVDCGGLIYEVYGKWFGPFAPFPETYPPDWAVHRRNELYLDFIKPYVVPVILPIVGGITLFRYGANYSHAAIYTEKNTFIHAWGMTNGGAVRESRPGFFVNKGGLSRPAQHFDVRQ